MPDQSSSPTPQELHIRLTELENSVKALTDTLQRTSLSPQICQVCQPCYICYHCYICRPICVECRPICYECGGCGPCLQEGRMR